MDTGLLDAFSRLTNLQTLAVMGTGPDDAVVPPLVEAFKHRSRFPVLRRIHMGGNKISLEGQQRLWAAWRGAGRPDRWNDQGPIGSSMPALGFEQNVLGEVKDPTLWGKDDVGNGQDQMGFNFGGRGYGEEFQKTRRLDGTVARLTIRNPQKRDPVTGLFPQAQD